VELKEMKIENWRKLYNEELIKLFRDLDVLSYIRIRRVNWIFQVNRMDCKRNVNQVFHNNSQGTRLSRRSRNRWWKCAETDVNRCKN
jgi:hypothetical protein